MNQGVYAFEDRFVNYWRDSNVTVEWIIDKYETLLLEGIAKRDNGARPESFNIAVDNTRNKRIAVFYKGGYVGACSRLQALYCIIIAMEDRHRYGETLAIVPTTDG